MARSLSMAKAMASLVEDIFPLRTDIDDAMDAGELLSFRYTNVLGNVCLM